MPELFQQLLLGSSAFCFSTQGICRRLFQPSPHHCLAIFPNCQFFTCKSVECNCSSKENRMSQCSSIPLSFYDRILYKMWLWFGFFFNVEAQNTLNIVTGNFHFVPPFKSCVILAFPCSLQVSHRFRELMRLFHTSCDGSSEDEEDATSTSNTDQLSDKDLLLSEDEPDD